MLVKKLLFCYVFDPWEFKKGSWFLIAYCWKLTLKQNFKTNETLVPGCLFIIQTFSDWMAEGIGSTFSPVKFQTDVGLPDARCDGFSSPANLTRSVCAQ